MSQVKTEKSSSQLDKRLSSVESTQMKLAYICVPNDGDWNAYRERSARCAMFTMARGFVPIDPLAMYGSLSLMLTPVTQIIAGELACQLMAHCDELWIFGDEILPHMEGAVVIAKKMGLPVVYREMTGGFEIE